MAEHFWLTHSAVVHWRTEGVPLKRMRDVVKFTNGAVTLDDMIPGRKPRAKPSAGASIGAR